MNGLQISQEYLYGCLFNSNKKVNFINKNKAYSGFSSTQSKLCNEKEYEKIASIFKKRLNFIYNNTTLIEPVLKKQKKGGSIFNEKKLKDLFILPDEKIDYNKFYENLTGKERTYISSTRDINEVKAILLCFFHIDDFDISANSPFKWNSSQPYQIISEQEDVTPSILDETIEKIKKGEKIHPVNVDVEFTFNSKTNEIERQYYLSDGNHRIYTLKNNNYNGFVPVIVCDYLESSYLHRVKNHSKSLSQSLSQSLSGGRKKKRLLKNNFYV